MTTNPDRIGTRPMRRWTAERVAWLRQHWPAGVLVEEARAAINAMPGPLIGTDHAVKSKCAELAIRRSPEALAATRERMGHAGAQAHLPPEQRTPFVTPEPREECEPKVWRPLTPEEVDARMEARLNLARKMIRASAGDIAIMNATKLPLREVYRLAGEVRRERQERKRA